MRRLRKYRAFASRTPCGLNAVGGSASVVRPLIAAASEASVPRTVWKHKFGVRFGALYPERKGFGVADLAAGAYERRQSLLGVVGDIDRHKAARRHIRTRSTFAAQKSAFGHKFTAAFLPLFRYAQIPFVAEKPVAECVCERRPGTVVHDGLKFFHESVEHGKLSFDSRGENVFKVIVKSRPAINQTLFVADARESRHTLPAVCGVVSVAAVGHYAVFFAPHDEFFRRLGIFFLAREACQKSERVRRIGYSAVHRMARRTQYSAV